MSPTMKTLVIKPADLSLNSLDTSSSVASTLVSVVYDRDVAVDGHLIPRVPLLMTVLDTDGVSVRVVVNDDDSITQGAGFAIEVVLTLQPRQGVHPRQGAPTAAVSTVQRTIIITSDDADTVNLADKADAVAVADPVQYVQAIDAINAATAAQAAAEMSQRNADSSAAAALSAKADAKRAADQAAPTDAGVAQLVRAGTQTTEALSFGNQTPVNVLAYAPAADGATDDSSKLLAAKDAARSGRTMFTARGLYVPAGVTMYINQVVDLRYILDVRIDGLIVVGPAGKLIVGHSSNQRPGQTIKLASVKWAQTSQTNCCVEVRGMKQATLTVLQCSRLDMVADDTSDAVNDGSIAYNEVHLGKIPNLNLTGIGSGWITQNQFFGGDVSNLTVSGTYGHNQNVWWQTCFEGGTINFACGARNRVVLGRGESAATAQFGAGTNRNVIEDAFQSNPAIRAPGVSVTSDAGVENVVIAAGDRELRQFEIATIDQSTTVLGGARAWDTGDPVTPGLGKHSTQAWKWLLDTGIFPIAQAVPGVLAETYEHSWALRRLSFVSDATTWRAYVTLYDAAGAPITTAGAVDASGGLSVSGSDWVNTSDKNAIRILIRASNAVSARVRIRAGATPTLFSYARLLGFTLNPSTDTGVEYVIRQMRRPLFQAAKPVMGLSPVGTIVQGPSGSWKVTARADTTLSASAATGDTNITVASAAGVASGDVIGVALDSGVTHWTSVSSLNGATLALAAALPAAATANRQASTVRWA